MAGLRPAASLILAVPATDAPFKILLMKRSPNMKFLPGVHVFPGGAVDAHDDDPEWRNLLPYSSPPMLNYRIAAIRETFEESGILLANPKEMVEKISAEDLVRWRPLVSGNASQFLKMCKEFQIYPEVAALREWSNWITPESQPIRYDTTFFLVILDHQPLAVHDNKEATSTDWLSPNDVIEKDKTNEIKVTSPQICTIIDLQEVSSLQELDQVAQDRSVYPIMTSMASLEDGSFVIALPGDPLHSEGATSPNDRHRLVTKMDGDFMVTIREKTPDLFWKGSRL